ncbi:hypothetical protein TNCV_2131401 [Trichonephila clavipes]|nr:hypothetical protein TNCV_2131401 [Trichonephila clavipes]
MDWYRSGNWGPLPYKIQALENSLFHHKFRKTTHQVTSSSRQRTRGRRVMSSSQILLKTPVQRGLMHVKYVEAQMSLRWGGVEIRRGMCQLSSRPRHLTMVQNDEIHREKPSFS